MIQIGAYRTRSDAELAQSALAVAGIASEVIADDAGGAYPFDLTGAVRLVMVGANEADVESALALLGGGSSTERTDD
jgi:hypothetical protein